MEKPGIRNGPTRVLLVTYLLWIIGSLSSALQLYPLMIEYIPCSSFWVEDNSLSMGFSSSIQLHAKFKIVIVFYY